MVIINVALVGVNKNLYNIQCGLFDWKDLTEIKFENRK